MEPQTPAARARWLELTLEGLAHEARSLRVRVRALAVLPPELPDAARPLVALLLEQLAVIDRQCAFLHAQFAGLGRATGDHRPGAGPVSDPWPPDHAAAVAGDEAGEDDP